MSKYKPGETSDEVIKKKTDITDSIVRKSILLDAINSSEDIPATLEIRSNSISEGAVHKWCDDELGIISYARNSAHTIHNEKALKNLLDSIANANARLSQENIEENVIDEATLSNTHGDPLVAELRRENEMLRKALAEVYRAYMQIMDNYREDEVVDDAMRNLIKDQAIILGRGRVWRVK